MNLRFSVPGVPIPWARTRVAISTFGKARFLNPPALTAYEDQVASAAAIAAKQQGWTISDGAYSVVLTFRFALPKRTSNRKRELLIGTPHSQRPDIDNLTKAILDGMTKAHVWVDDASIACLTTRKVWAEEPGVDVEVLA